MMPVPRAALCIDACFNTRYHKCCRAPGWRECRGKCHPGCIVLGDVELAGNFKMWNVRTYRPPQPCRLNAISIYNRICACAIVRLPPYAHLYRHRREGGYARTTDGELLQMLKSHKIALRAYSMGHNDHNCPCEPSGDPSDADEWRSPSAPFANNRLPLTRWLHDKMSAA